MTFIDFMAGLALAVFWVHMLLMAADAIVQWRSVRQLGARLRAGGLVAGQVESGRGPEGVLAEQRTEQRGRSKGDGVIHFHDRAHESEVFGGSVKLDDGSLIDLPAASGDGVQVWPSRELRSELAGPSSKEAFDEVYGAAQKARGWTRVVRVPVRAGDRVWVLPDPETPLIAATDPRGWTRQRGAMVLGFVSVHLVLSAACTAAAVWPPMYDTVSKIGAFVSFVYFMQIQDFTRILRERLRPPSRAFLRGEWTRPPG
jgi:hypothetical protein